MRQVLVVDDAALVRGLLRDVLRSEGYVIHEAVNSRDALARYREVRPDVVTMDLALPDGSGIDCVARIREFDADARVVVITALSRDESEPACARAGALGFVSKPFTPEQVAEAVRQCLSASPASRDQR